MKLSICINNCQITSAMLGENEDLSHLITKSQEDTKFSYNGWEVQVYINMNLKEGSILVRHLPTESFPKKIQKRHRLVDGNITIDESLKHLVYFSRMPIYQLLAENFGVTGLIKKELDGIKMQADWDPCGHSGAVELAYMLSDGKCYYSCEASQERNVPLEEMSENMILRQGEICLKAEGASWVILCKYSKSETMYTQECVLYTMRSNVFLLMRELEAFLERSSYARFEDCFEEFLLD